jgi:hypothetical protein
MGSASPALESRALALAAAKEMAMNRDDARPQLICCAPRRKLFAAQSCYDAGDYKEALRFLDLCEAECTPRTKKTWHPKAKALRAKIKRASSKRK